MKKIIYYFAFILFLFLSSCSKNKNYVSVDKTHALRAYYKLPENSDFSFAILHFKDNKKPLDTFQRKNDTITFLQPNREYELDFYNKENIVFGTSSFKTEKLPTTIKSLEPKVKTDIQDNGYFLYNQTFNVLNKARESHELIIADFLGHIVWYETFADRILSFSVTTQNTILVLLNNLEKGSKIVELNKKGTILNETEWLQEINLHREIILHEGSYLSIAYDTFRMDRSHLGGGSSDIIVSDKIVKLDKKGKVLQEYPLSKYYDCTKIDNFSPLAEVIHQFGETAQDFTHCNAISIDQDGNYLISVKNFNQILKINKDSGEKIWTIGAGWNGNGQGSISMSPEYYFFRQHTITKTQDGHYMVFDNGDVNLRKTSRILLWKIDSNNQASDFKRIDLPENLFSSAMGSVYENPATGNLLISSGNTGTVLEITKPDKSRFGYQIAGKMYRAFYIQK